MSSLSIDIIRCDGGTQMRVSISDTTVDGYATDMESGHEFPPVTVFYDGKAHWLADGFHRIAARQRVASKHIGTESHKEWSSIAVDVRAGTREDAIRYAIGANKKNGLRRTNADKDMAVRAALAHPQMQSMSDKAIADEAGVSTFKIHTARKVLENRTSTQVANSTHKAVNTKTDIAMRTGVDGKKYPVRQNANPTKAKAQESAPKTAHADKAPARADKEKHVCPHCKGSGYIYE